MTAQPFSPGTVIEARRRLWRVDAVWEEELVATTIDGGETEQHRFYLPFEQIRSASLETPSAGRIGRWAAQSLLLRAYQLSLMHGTAPFLSLQRSRVIPTNYQLIPLVMSLEMPRVRMAIFDDVGLGKTIESGLVIAELLARQRVRNTLVICPANLREQWRKALEYFFHIDVRIISTRHRREMERQLPVGANPWEYYRHLIVSVDYAKQPAIKNQILEQPWDLVLIDEAHQVAKPHQQVARQSVEMDRWELARAVAKVAQHFLLLTATPHSGYSDSFASLLDMLDVGAVQGPTHAPRIERTLARQHVVQRRRDDVEQWFLESGDRKSPFPKRDQNEIAITPSQQERDAITAVEDLGRLILGNAHGSRGRVLAHWTVLHLHKRALSSPEALRRSLRNRMESLRRKLTDASQPEDVESLPEEVARATAFDGDPGERYSEEEAFRWVERGLYGDAVQLKGELEQLQQALSIAEKVTPTRDEKLNHLLHEVLHERLRQYPRLVIFTRYLDTLEYLEKQINTSKIFRQRYPRCQVITLYGELNESQRRERFIQFEQAAQAIMLATDCISEGINLQHACNQIIHYELPWNPNRLEQRNGRVDRFGQPREEVVIRTLVMNESLDATILAVLVEKAKKIRKEYGFSPPYFGDEEIILGLIQEHGKHAEVGVAQLSLFAEAAEQRGTELIDPFGKDTLERIRDESFYGQTDLQLPDIESRLEQTYHTIGSPEEIQRFVLSGLNRYGVEVQETQTHTYKMLVANDHLKVTGIGRVTDHGVLVLDRAGFDPQAAADDPSIELLDIAHPLVRRLIDLVKHSAFREGEHYGRTAWLATPSVAEVTAVFHLLVRYVAQTRPATVLEELVPVAVPVYGHQALSEEELQRMLAGKPVGNISYTDTEAGEALVDALRHPLLPQAIEEAIGRRCARLVAERQRLKDKLLEDGQTASTWLEGIDQVTPVSHDVLTATLYYPAT